MTPDQHPPHEFDSREILARLERLERRLEGVETRLRRLEPTTPEAPLAAEKPQPRPEPQPPEPARPAAPPPVPGHLKPPPPSKPEPAPAARPVETPRPESPRPAAPGLDEELRRRLKAQPWRQWLEQIHMLPPEGGGLEAPVMAWWLSRLGGVLAIVGLVLLAGYMDAPPWIKFMELAAVSLAVAVGGLWLERRHGRFGAVVFATGLAMIYFTSFAAHTMSAVRVIQSPTLAIVAQLLALALMLGAALIRREPVLASLGIGLGYVSGFFSQWIGYSGFSLVMGGLLGAGAVGLYWRRDWRVPWSVAVPLAHLLYLVVAAHHWIEVDPAARPVFWVALLYPFAMMLLFIAADYGALRMDRLMPYRLRRSVQLCNTTAALILGWWVSWELYADQLEWFYFVFGAALLAAALLYWRADRRDVMSQVYFVKATALITMGLITRYEARTRWAALGVESVVLLLSARRSGRRVVEATATAAWFISGYFFLSHMIRFAFRGDPPSFASITGLLAIAYVLISAAFFGLKGRWMHPHALGQRLGDEAPDVPWLFSRIIPFSPQRYTKFHQASAGVYAFFAGIAAWAANVTFAPDDWTILSGAVMFLALAALIGAVRHWAPIVPAAFCLLIAHLAFWESRIGETPWIYWANATAVLLVTVAAALALPVVAQRVHFQKQHLLWLASGLLHALWMYTLTHAFGETFEFDGYLLACVALAVAVALGSAQYRRFPYLVECSVLPFFYSLWHFYIHLESNNSDLIAARQDWLLLVPIALALLYPNLFLLWRPLKGRPQTFADPRIGDALRTLAAGLVGLTGLYLLFADADLMLSLALVGVAWGAMTRWPGLKPALIAGGVYILLAHLKFYDLLMQPQIEPLWVFLIWAPLVAAATLAYTLSAPRWLPEKTAGIRRFVYAPGGALALILWFAMFEYDHNPVEQYASAWWGVGAILIFLAGLLDRSRPLRLVALAGLLLCVIRVFRYDVQTRVQGIVAFFVLAAVVLFTAFLYQKYGHLIEQRDYESEAADTTDVAAESSSLE